MKNKKIFCSLEHEHKYVIFLSEVTIDMLKRNCCCAPIDYFKKKDLNNFYKLYQKERLLTILNTDNIDFKEKKIYFDDIDTNMPKFDNLYIKVNEHFYISYKEYLKCITQFNFNLYSSVFTKFGLKKITCEISNHIMKKRNISNQLNVGVGKLNVQVNEQKDKSIVEIIGESFNIDPYDYKRIILYRELCKKNRRNQMYQHLPTNIKGENIMFIGSLNMNKINKAIDDNLSTINYQFEISVSEILNIYVGLGESYTPLNISNEFGFELEQKEDQSIKINYEFYDFNVLKESFNSIQQKEYYLSTAGRLRGPWPTQCNKINSKSGIGDFSKALAISTLEIKKDPKNIIIEIRNDFGWNGITYSVHIWRLDKNKTIGLTVGPGVRYLYFSNIYFRDRSKLIQKLREIKYA